MNRRALLALPLLAVRPARARAATPLSVVATNPILADLTAEIAGPDAAVASLVAPGGDPHVFQPKPSDAARVAAASVLVENGLGLEGWLSRLTRSAGFKGVLAVASAGVAPRMEREGGRSAPDPHIWQDPRLARRMVATIAAALAKADPAHAAGYAERASRLDSRIAATDSAIAAQIEGVPRPRRRIITTHDAFGYYGLRFGVEFLAAEGLSTEAEPTPAGLARLAAQIRRDKVHAVFAEVLGNPRVMETLAAEAGATLGPPVYSDTLSPPGGPAATYLQMLEYNTAAFVAAMQRNPG
jgi:zinc/manganese transport system substrate-binding protein